MIILEENNLSDEVIDQEVSEFIKNPNSSLGMDFNIYSPFRVDLLQLDATAWISFLEKINTLPPSIKSIVTSADTIEKIIKISEDFDLSNEQSANISRITRDVLLADAFLGDFSAVISSKLGVDMNTANQIAQKIVTELFVPAIEDIKNMQREKFRDRIAQSRSSQTQQPPPSVEQGNVINLRNRENQ